MLQGSFVNDPFQVQFHVEFPLETRSIHVPDHAEHRPILPGPVVFPEAPGDTRIPVRVAPVKFVLIIEIYGGRKGLFRRGTPLEDFLSPVHPHVRVHPAGRPDLGLGGIPRRVMGPSLLQFVGRIRERTLVRPVVVEGLLCPRRKSFHPPVHRENT